MSFARETMAGRQDDLEFNRYELRGSRMCAILRSRINGAEIAFDRPSLKARIDNLRSAGDPFEQTTAALSGFPES